MLGQIGWTRISFRTWLLIHVTINIGVLVEPSVHPCRRICKKDEEPRVCEYDFEISQWSTMGRACYNCPKNITDCLDPLCAPADGRKKGIIVVNKQLPGPMIEVCKGDRVIVKVKNKLITESTSIHWHGLHQRGTQYMDGVPYVTQCPILPLQSFVYNFTADVAGSHFWHSHSFEQRADGLFGGFIVREPLNCGLYEVDDHVLITNEWTERAASDAFALNVYSAVDPGPYNVLINGLGRYPANSTNMILTSFEVEEGKRYRFRIINAGSQDCPIILTIEKHGITIISMDGHDIVPVKVDSIRMMSGERYDIVLEANKKPNNYWIKVKGTDGDICENKKLFQMAILRYRGSDKIDPPSTPTFDTFDKSESKQLNPFNEGIEHPLCIVNQDSAMPDDKANMREPDHQFFVTYDPLIDGRFANNFKRQGAYRDVPLRNGRTFWRLNTITFELPSMPLLTQYDMIDPRFFCNSSTIDDCYSKFCECTHMLRANLDSIVELVLIDEGYIKINHPMHLHGYTFRVVGMGTFYEPASIDLFKKLDKEGKIQRKLKAAPLKDTVMVPFRGYTILRFHANNPGVWLFHCHFERHAHNGMELVIKVGEVKDFPKAPANIPRC